ncbi:uncharacterized protein LY79DRAFT_672127 [Colletotrichum navitas]|uniref:AtmA protein n=1 Tax=Colletotrichum navitas TaxID=681940 RepID=A0AAD8PT41_9PEZI|nr:uncharacterized protein LY79DRAFT_672127 [Colletotrichum navitas]KAK1580091.1 hypothetical protein LY79DRAFT_672127 [Colletotrichum navitas]
MDPARHQDRHHRNGAALTPAVRLVLYSLSIAGGMQLWGRSLVDGTLVKLLSAVHGPDPYQLPGTQTQLKSSFTGVFAIDYLLRILVVFFWEVADGSHPASSAIGLYFLGQYFSVLLVFYLEDSRHGARPSYVRPTLWLLLFQATGIGCAGPLWVLSHLGASNGGSVGRMSSLKDSLERAAPLSSPHVPFLILAALVMGYAAPASLMLLPSPRVLSADSKQFALVLWNIFPIWVLAALLGLRSVLPLARSSQQQPAGSFKDAAAVTQLRTNRRYIANMALVYAPALIVSVYSHIAVLAATVSTRLFPALFRPEHLASLTPWEVFVPPLSVVAGQTVGDGTRSFMLWDQVFGYGTVGIVMLLRLRSAADAVGRPLGSVKMVTGILLASLVAGPGSACLLACWVSELLLLLG